jgi:hypothetical protein
VCVPVTLSDGRWCRGRGRGRVCVFVLVLEMTWPVVAEGPSQDNLKSEWTGLPEKDVRTAPLKRRKQPTSTH